MENKEIVLQENLKPIREKHSGLGISAFIIAMVSGVIFWISVIMATAVELSNGSGGDAELMYGLVGLVMFFVLFLNLIGTGLGIAGVIQKTKKRLFAILGIVFNGLTIVVFIFLLILGLAFG